MASEKASSSRSRADSAFTVASVGTRSRLSRPAVQPASQSAAGRLDPMTADPDEIFTKLSVREVREFEGRIR